MQSLETGSNGAGGGAVPAAKLIPLLAYILYEMLILSANFRHDCYLNFQLNLS